MTIENRQELWLNPQIIGTFDSEEALRLRRKWEPFLNSAKALPPGLTVKVLDELFDEWDPEGLLGYFDLKNEPFDPDIFNSYLFEDAGGSFFSEDEEKQMEKEAEAIELQLPSQDEIDQKRLKTWLGGVKGWQE